MITSVFGGVLTPPPLFFLNQANFRYNLYKEIECTEFKKLEVQLEK